MICSFPLRPWFIMVLIFGVSFLFQKRKLSWSDPEDYSKIPTKRTHNQHESCLAATPLNTASTCLPGSPKKQRSPEDKTKKPAEEHKGTFNSCTLSRRGVHENQGQSEVSLPSSCESLATQDSSVSSSDILTTADSTSQAWADLAATWRCNWMLAIGRTSLHKD